MSKFFLGEKENKMNDKILFYQWNAFMQNGIEASMTRMGIEYDKFYYIIKDWDKDNEFEKKLEAEVTSGGYKTVFSVNFCPIISDVCQRHSVHYISWVYDAPLHIKRVDALKNSCNDIYFFDYIQCNTYIKSGVSGAHHLTLAVDTDIFADKGRDNKHPASWYECDVSLVGQLYKSTYNYICGPLDEYYRGYLEGIVRAQQKVYGGYIIGDMLDDKLLDSLNEFYYKASDGEGGVSKKQLEYSLGTEVTGRDRFTVLALLQNRCRVNLYSNDKDDRLGKVSFKGYVDYDTQMPEVFRRSKINLNISLRLIQSGIPLRVLDVLGCGGFLITNYQQEIAEDFENGRDLVIYEDYVDLVEKVEYYLIHEEERKAIALNGYNKVRELFNFDDRVRIMFERTR